MAVIVAASLGCATQPPAPTDAGSDPYDWEKEGTVPALAATEVRREVDRPHTFEEIAADEESVAVEDVAPAAADSLTAPPDSMKLVDGYRVQVFASGARESAEEVSAAVASTLGVAAYVERVDGVYKVRVGDCRSRSDAEALLARCRNGGYPDAWIVAGRVRAPRP